MKKAKVLALILAGGKGGRLGALTKNRAKPVMPFAGSYRLIDFALSNCLHSEISDVWIIEQYQLHSLNEHLSNGRPWDLDRTYGGLRICRRLKPLTKTIPKAVLPPATPTRFIVTAILYGNLTRTWCWF